MKPAGDQARVTVTVAVPAAQAFRVFTEQIDQWWRRGGRFRHAGGGRGIVAIEPRLDGRLFEAYDAADGAERVVELGRVLAWEPPRRLVFEWRNADFTRHEKTEVEVSFESVDAARTRVVLLHRGFASLRPDHPVRHGLDAPAFLRMMGLWWGEQLTALRRLAAPSPGSGAKDGA